MAPGSRHAGAGSAVGSVDGREHIMLSCLLSEPAVLAFKG